MKLRTFVVDGVTLEIPEGVVQLVFRFPHEIVVIDEHVDEEGKKFTVVRTFRQSEAKYYDERT
mgnify:CR=1 FL=1